MNYVLHNVENVQAKDINDSSVRSKSNVVPNIF
jgi:hypothetical protein